VKKPPRQSGEFRKVGECLYRYSSNGVYYARFKTNGKEIRRSLETTDRAETRRKLADEKEKERQTDRSQGKLTLRELCERYGKTAVAAASRVFTMAWKRKGIWLPHDRASNGSGCGNSGVPDRARREICFRDPGDFGNTILVSSCLAKKKVKIIPKKCLTRRKKSFSIFDYLRRNT